MLKIFGSYSFSKPDPKTIQKSKDIFEIPSIFTKFNEFNFGNIYINYESTNSEEAANFYFVAPNKTLACFIIGNIYASEENTLEILPRKNLAKLILTKYKEGNLNFLKYLRGIFNIVIIDKNCLFLINDNLGLSPMYTLKTDDGLLFCNQAEPIIWLNNKNYVDYSSIAEFIVYGFVPNGKTFFRSLGDQPPATIIKVNKQNISEEKYTTFSPADLKGLNHKEKVQLVKDTFSEAIRIRLNEGRVFSELSGGWDTRFVLANLLELNADVIPFTVRREEKDLTIAKKITSKKKLEHIILNSTTIPSSLKNDYTFKFKPRKTIFDNIHGTDIFNKDMNYLRNMKFFTSPRFTGLFGTEFFGYVPHSVTRSIGQNLNTVSYRLFLRDFLFKVYDTTEKKGLTNLEGISGSTSPVLLFLNQILRSYMHSHYASSWERPYASSWERPTSLFSYLFIKPFADSKFVAVLSSLDYDKCMHYELYGEVYNKYFPGFLKFPWTDTTYRVQYSPNKKATKKKAAGPRKYDKLLQLVADDKKFRNFIKTNKIIQKTNFAIGARLKELYFIFNWFEVHKSILSDSQAKSLIKFD